MPRRSFGLSQPSTRKRSLIYRYFKPKEKLRRSRWNAVVLNEGKSNFSNWFDLNWRREAAFGRNMVRASTIPSFSLPYPSIVLLAASLFIHFVFIFRLFGGTTRNLSRQRFARCVKIEQASCSFLHCFTLRCAQSSLIMAKLNEKEIGDRGLNYSSCWSRFRPRPIVLVFRFVLVAIVWYR